MIEYAMQTSVSGRYLLRVPPLPEPAPLLVGFHGYGQRAEEEFDLLCAIPGSGRWLCCSIEALHPFYTPSGNSGASWMTSRDREQRIEENVRYVDGVIDRIRALHPVTDLLCFHGFSQGTGMACRAALLGIHPPSGLMLLGGDIPPELELSGMPPVHLARGHRDRIYTEERYQRDAAMLQAASVPFLACTFTGGHASNDDYLQSAGEFLGGVQ